MSYLKKRRQLKVKERKESVTDEEYNTINNSHTTIKDTQPTPVQAPPPPPQNHTHTKRKGRKERKASQTQKTPEAKSKQSEAKPPPTQNDITALLTAHHQKALTNTDGYTHHNTYVTNLQPLLDRLHASGNLEANAPEILQNNANHHNLTARFHRILEQHRPQREGGPHDEN